MSKLTMHERLPFDEARRRRRCRPASSLSRQASSDVVTEAYERYRTDDDGAVADYIPALASASPDLFGICVVGVAAGRSRSATSTTTFSIQSVSKPFVFALVCDARRVRRGATAGSASTAPASRSTR